MATYECYEVEMTEQRDIIRSQSASFSIDVPETPSKGSLILRENDFYTVLDIVYRSNAPIVLFVVKMASGIVPEFYKECL